MSSGVATRARSRLVVVGLVLLAAAMTAVGVVGLLRAHDLRSVTAADNRALVDPGATDEVKKQVSSALTRILTFDHADPDQTQKAAEEVLDGKARSEYDELFAALLDQAASQQLTLTTKIEDVGVKELDADSAELLVFLDQSSTRATDGQSNVAAAQLAVTAVREGGRWRITGLDPL